MAILTSQVAMSYAVAGTMPAIFMMESMMDHVAKVLGMDTEAVKKMNLYKQGQVCMV